MTPIDPKVKADALAELLPGFIRRRKEDILVLHEAAGANDFARVAEVAHKIRGNGATFGFPELSDRVELVALAMGLFGVADFLRNVNHMHIVGSGAKVRPASSARRVRSSCG